MPHAQAVTALAEVLLAEGHLRIRAGEDVYGPHVDIVLSRWGWAARTQLGRCAWGLLRTEAERSAAVCRLLEQLAMTLAWDMLMRRGEVR